jgi:hypothetical protein
MGIHAIDVVHVDKTNEVLDRLFPYIVLHSRQGVPGLLVLQEFSTCVALFG